MAGKIYVGGQRVPTGPTPMLAPGNANNIQPPQREWHPAFTVGGYHIPQAPFPMPTTPIKLPWGAGSRGITV